MPELNEHLSSEDFNFFFAASKKRTSLNENELKKYHEIKNHLDKCKICKEEFDALKEIYFNEVDTYKKRKTVRNSLIASTVTIFLIYFLFLPESVTDKKFTEDSTITGSNPIILNKPSQTDIPINASIDSSLINKSTEASDQLAEHSELDGIPFQQVDKSITLFDLLNSYKKLNHDSVEINLFEYSIAKNFDLPKNYIEDELQEIQINESYLRSINEDINISPQNLSISSLPINFKWNVNSGQVTIVIKNNKNQKVWEKSFTETKEYIFRDSLSDGLYYWDVRLNNRVKQKNKFFLINKL